MTEQEQKAFTAMREALEEIICAHPATSTMRQVHAIVAGRNALAAANAVQPQFMGFDVVVDPTMKPNEMKLVQPQAQVGALPIEGSEAADNAIHSMLCERQWPSSSMNAARAGWRAARLFAHPQATEPQAQGDVDNPHNVDKPNEQADYGHDNSVSFGFQTPYYCAKCNEHMGDTDLPKNVPLRKYAVCYGCQEKATHPQSTEPQAQGKDHLNVASQCRATASHPISQQIEVDGGNGTLFMLLMDAAHSIEQLMATHPQATEPASPDAP